MRNKFFSDVYKRHNSTFLRRALIESSSRTRKRQLRFCRVPLHVTVDERSTPRILCVRFWFNFLTELEFKNDEKMGLIFKDVTFLNTYKKWFALKTELPKSTNPKVLKRLFLKTKRNVCRLRLSKQVTWWLKMWHTYLHA